MDFEMRGIDGRPLDQAAFEGNAVLVVNVASRCGLTPQYEGLERLQQRYGDAGFTVLDQGVQLKDGVIRIALSENLVDLQQVEFHGASGTSACSARRTASPARFWPRSA